MLSVTDGWGAGGCQVRPRCSSSKRRNRAGPCGLAPNGSVCSPINVKRSRTYEGVVRSCSASASIVRWWLERARIRMVADPLELMGLVVRNFGAVKNFDWEATNKTVMQSFFAP